MWVWVKKEDGLAVVQVSYFFVVHVLNMLLNFETILTDGKMNNNIILQHQKLCAFLQSI